MTGDIVNLRMARKRKERAARQQVAAENRAKHGRTKSEKRVDAARQELETRRLDQARRQDRDDD